MVLRPNTFNRIDQVAGVGAYTLSRYYADPIAQESKIPDHPKMLF
ncbi:hypothetical protein ALP58_101136 [Pseudomonas savastanoi]|uniref:Uncharacterized protein n=4 Tax=Pseudomonas syringae group TaxID=136849 RepID=A0A9X0H2U3_PSESX|nr:Uncharacterized protein AC510_4791 [Pseudomonas amygdali pv. myricae]KPW99573.1 hypothetical protein ALO79_100203 [Pseudomonas syringae pv. castaneae]KPX11114.1 hypothetical protein ALO73_101240 [Pseudomonas syringae pv. daphniphylli]RMO12576.1 hypothetical protein ALQ46_101093 [Pseudomonas savastanoi pv. phaseolicola]RMS83710.1 hypothetical protein ALP58_101136 [Pseudomonas savastanoi]